MEHTTTHCDHHWRYFVDLQARAVRIRECERCRQRTVLATHLEPLPQAAAQKLTA